MLYLYAALGAVATVVAAYFRGKHDGRAQERAKTVHSNNEAMRDTHEIQEDVSRTGTDDLRDELSESGR
jgi:hypothetical protein